MSENIHPKIEGKVLVGHLSDEEREQLASVGDNPGWKVLMNKIILPRSKRVMSEVMTSSSIDKESVFRDVIFTRGQLHEHGLMIMAIQAAKSYKPDEDEDEEADETK